MSNAQCPTHKDGIHFAVLACVLLAAPPAFADAVVLKNGKAVEGIISRETRTSLELDVGVGTMTFPSNGIRSVVRVNAATNDRLRNGWGQQYFLYKRNVPAGAESLAEDVRRLLDIRADTIRLQREAAGAPARELKIEADIEAIHRTLVTLSQQVKTAVPKDDPEKYNQLVSDMNSRVADGNIKAQELEDLRKIHQKAKDQVSSYLQRLTTVETEFGKRATELRGAGSDPAMARFLDQVGSRIKELSAECHSFSIETKNLRGNHTVTALVNGRVRGVFIIDTGAGSLAMSRAFADRLGLDLTGARQGETSVADGRKVKVDVVMLESVQVEQAVAHQVEAVVMPTSDDQVDGLLGMSFLRNFLMQMDGNTGRLILKEFAPQ